MARQGLDREQRERDCIVTDFTNERSRPPVKEEDSAHEIMRSKVILIRCRLAIGKTDEKLPGRFRQSAGDPDCRGDRGPWEAGGVVGGGDVCCSHTPHNESGLVRGQSITKIMIQGRLRQPIQF